MTFAEQSTGSRAFKSIKKSLSLCETHLKQQGTAVNGLSCYSFIEVKGPERGVSHLPTDSSTMSSCSSACSAVKAVCLHFLFNIPLEQEFGNPQVSYEDF